MQEGTALLQKLRLEYDQQKFTNPLTLYTTFTPTIEVSQWEALLSCVANRHNPKDQQRGIQQVLKNHWEITTP